MGYHAPPLPSYQARMGGSGGLGTGGIGKRSFSLAAMGLSCQLNAQMPSWNPGPSPAPELGTETE